MTLGESKNEMDLKKVKQGIIDFPGGQEEPVVESAINEQVEGKKSHLVKGLRELVVESVVLKHGKGGKGDPLGSQSERGQK